MKKSKRDITTPEALLMIITILLATLLIWFTCTWKTPEKDTDIIHGEIGIGETIEEAEKNAKPY